MATLHCADNSISLFKYRYMYDESVAYPALHSWGGHFLTSPHGDEAGRKKIGYFIFKNGYKSVIFWIFWVDLLLVLQLKR